MMGSIMSIGKARSAAIMLHLLPGGLGQGGSPGQRLMVMAMKLPSKSACQPPAVRQSFQRSGGMGVVSSSKLQAG
jgi:hypothetical protein